jgi:hypothetical protein
MAAFNVSISAMVSCLNWFTATTAGHQTCWHSADQIHTPCRHQRDIFFHVFLLNGLPHQHGGPPPCICCTTATITAHLSFKLRAALDIENFFNIGYQSRFGHTETVFAHQFKQSLPQSRTNCLWQYPQPRVH